MNAEGQEGREEVREYIRSVNDEGRGETSQNVCLSQPRALLGWRETDQLVFLLSFYLRAHVVKYGCHELLGKP
jgi:hypothetical protein